MLRLAAGVLVAVLVAIPLAVLPAAPVTWLAMAALGVGGAGVLVLSVPMVTTGASLALIAYASALVIAGPAVDPVAAIAVGATLVLLLALVHFAGRVQGAALGPAVIAAQVRHWLVIVALGAAAAVGLTAGGVVLGPTLRGASMPVVVVAAALGALMTTAGVIALVTARKDLPATTGR
jgi:predicted Co/Zn/Cd cation transporter (cation efflux family)